MAVLSTVLHAQSALEVILIDNLNNPVVFHPITIANYSINFNKEFLSDKNGKVQLQGLSTSGNYIVTAAESGIYQTKKITGITLISGNTSSVVLTLSENVQSLDGITIIASDYQTINTINAEVASELSLKQLESLPVEGRDVTRALYRLPNITQATGFFPEAPNVAINGANALYTNYQIDGLDNNENFLGGQRFAMPIGFTQNITALTNNFSAEHGLTSNGIINITTKSGANDTFGEVFFVTRPGPAIDAPSAFAQRDLSGNQVRDGFQRYQRGLGVGGALKKDKTYYFINFEKTTDIKDNLLKVPQLGINETVRGTNQFNYFSTKLDYYWSEKFRSSVFVNLGNVSIERQGGGLDGGSTFPSAGNTQQRNSLNVALKNTYSSSNLTYEGNYLFGRFIWDYAKPVDSNDPNVTVLDPTGQVMAAIGHPGYVFKEIENMHLIQQKLTISKGSHLIKTGMQLKSSAFQLFGGGNPNGSYTVQLSASQLNVLQSSGIGTGLTPQDLPSDVSVLNYGIELRPNAFQKTQNIFSLYLEDQWSVNSRLNFNFGLRYDYDNLSKGGGNTGDKNNLAPRLSANYKLTDRSVVRAGYGIYYDKILYAVYSDALQFNSTSADYKKQLAQLITLGILPTDANLEAMTNEGNLVANDPNATYLQGKWANALQAERGSIFQNELRVLNPSGYQNPYSHQLMLGFQRKLNANCMFYIDALYNRSENLFRLKNLNSPAPYPINPANVVVRSTQEADLSRPIPIRTDAVGGYAVVAGDTLRGVARNIVMTETAGSSNYYALNFTFQKDRGEGDFGFRLMYTLSYLENNTEDINFRAMDSNDFEAEWGASINDRRHLINGIFNYFATDKLTFTLTGLLQSGQPINRIPDGNLYGTTDLNGDGRAFADAYQGNNDRSPGESRNSDRLPWASTFDFNLLYQFPVRRTHQLELSAQVFNLFNAVNLSGYANNATQSNQIQVGPTGFGELVRRNAAPPRQFQFSVRYLF